MTEEWDDAQDSGPFCRHWHALLDGPCEETCRRCGHACGEHEALYAVPVPGELSPCRARGCGCAEWAGG